MKDSRVTACVVMAMSVCVIGWLGCGRNGLCPDGHTSCNGACVDTRTSRDHCGLCQTQCGPDQVCTDSVCTGQCHPSLSLCHGMCTDLTTDADHCGACDNKCDDGLICIDHVCHVACPGNLTRCGELCVDRENDPDHCGSCETHCPAGYGCAEGECALACLGNEQGQLMTSKPGRVRHGAQGIQEGHDGHQS